MDGTGVAKGRNTMKILSDFRELVKVASIVNNLLGVYLGAQNIGKSLDVHFNRRSNYNLHTDVKVLELPVPLFIAQVKQ
jgi:amino acid permease